MAREYDPGDIIEMIGNPDIRAMVVASNKDITFVAPIVSEGSSVLVTQRGTKELREKTYTKVHRYMHREERR